MENKMNPLIRGIYYLFLCNWDVFEYLHVTDTDAFLELVNVGREYEIFPDWRTSYTTMMASRNVYIQEPIKRRVAKGTPHGK